MTTYTYAQLEALWIRNGGSKATAPLAAAIAEAESSGRSDVTSPNPDGGVNVGPWQLDTRGKGAGFTVAQLQQPNTNARLAVRGSSNGTDWSAWQTFVTGAYKPFLSGSVPPDTAGLPAAATLTAADQSNTQPPGACLVGPLPHTSFCVLSKSEARAFIGALLIVAGGLVALPGILLLGAFAFERSGAGQAAADAGAVLGRTPGYGTAYRAVTRRGGAAGRPEGPVETVTERAPIESDSGGTRITRTTTRPAAPQQRRFRRARPMVEQRTRTEERTPGATMGSTRTRVVTGRRVRPR